MLFSFMFVCLSLVCPQRVITIDERLVAYEGILNLRDHADYRFKLALVMSIVPVRLSLSLCPCFFFVLVVQFTNYLLVYLFTVSKTLPHFVC